MLSGCSISGSPEQGVIQHFLKIVVEVKPLECHMSQCGG